MSLGSFHFVQNTWPSFEIMYTQYIQRIQGVDSTLIKVDFSFLNKGDTIISFFSEQVIVPITL